MEQPRQTEPERAETFRWHRCFCVIIHLDGRIDPCPTRIDNPDQPMCDGCEEADHKLLAQQVPAADPLRARIEQTWRRIHERPVLWVDNTGSS